MVQTRVQFLEVFPLHEPRVLKARKTIAWGFQPQVRMPIYFGRAQGTQVIGMGVLTPVPRVRAPPHWFVLSGLHRKWPRTQGVVLGSLEAAPLGRQ